MQGYIDAIRERWPDRLQIVERATRQTVLTLGDGVSVTMNSLAVIVKKVDYGVIGGSLPAITSNEILIGRIEEALQR